MLPPKVAADETAVDVERAAEDANGTIAADEAEIANGRPENRQRKLLLASQSFAKNVQSVSGLSGSPLLKLQFVNRPLGKNAPPANAAEAGMTAPVARNARHESPARPKNAASQTVDPSRRGGRVKKLRKAGDAKSRAGGDVKSPADGGATNLEDGAVGTAKKLNRHGRRE
jgi:hypothetical protein